MDNIEVYYTRIFEKNLKSQDEITINIGGARSSKSYSLTQLFLTKFVSEKNKNFLISRKTFPSLRITALKVFLDMTRSWNIYNRFEHTKVEHSLTFAKNNNWLLFASIDDPEKIKSSEFNYIWLEEANEFTYDDYMILKLRLSGKKETNEINQMFLSLNPSEEFGWVNKQLIEKGIGNLIRSTYKDNPFLSNEYVRSLEALQNEDETYWKIYGLGEFAQLKNIVYHNHEIVSEFPEVFDETIYGLDFGFNNPTALIEENVKDKIIYEREFIYQTGLTNEDLIKKLNEIIIDKTKNIYADSAEPQRIEEISRAGFNIFPANKSVKDGIDFVKRQKIKIHKDSTNLIKEVNSYKYKEDRAGNVLDEPVKFLDHLMDGRRYSIFTHLCKAPATLVTSEPIEERRGRLFS